VSRRARGRVNRPLDPGRRTHDLQASNTEAAMIPANDRTDAAAENGPDRTPAIKRAAFVLLFLFCIAIAQTLLNIAAVIQAATVIITGQPNRFLVGFGRSLALWLGATTGYVTCATDAKPFPFAPWPKAE